MSIVFGHPAGNPNSFHAALAHYESGRLHSFCVPWVPSSNYVRWLQALGTFSPASKRIVRRHFPALADAPTVQGRLLELRRLALRAIGADAERLAYKANDWLMATMVRECRKSGVTAVHAYEDCSLLQFEEARRLGKACIYDLPIGFYPAWQSIEQSLLERYAHWIAIDAIGSDRYARLERKRREVELAELILVPSSFVESTVRSFRPQARVAVAPYGVDLAFWRPRTEPRSPGPMRFIYAGQMSIRKGTPLLLEAWEKAGLRDAELMLVGSWRLPPEKRFGLPRGVTWHPPCASQALLQYFHLADAFVFPSFFEGLGLVLLESMAAGLPTIATEATGASDVTRETCGTVIRPGDLGALVESIRWFDRNRDRLPDMGRAARARAEQFTWDNYRRHVSEAVGRVL